MIGEAAHADDIWMDMGGLDWATERKVEDALCCIGLVVEWLQGLCRWLYEYNTFVLKEILSYISVP